MPRVIRRRTTTVRIAWVEQTVTESVEETVAAVETIDVPPGEPPAKSPARPRRSTRQLRPARKRVKAGARAAEAPHDAVTQR